CSTISAIRAFLRSARRRSHEFRANRIGDGFAQDPIDLGLGCDIEPPARHRVDGLQLARMPRAPQRRGDALIEHPAHGKLNDVLAETFLSELVELLHRRQGLRKPGLSELWI